MTTDAHAAEADRQSRLLTSLVAAHADPHTLALREVDERALRGLQAYRANAQASAERALASDFPTIRALIGDGFAHIAWNYWRNATPTRGDLGVWGEGFADWLASQEQLAEWPYLADCARLDWSMHSCERAEDHALDVQSLQRLSDTDPSRLVIVLAPSLSLVESNWPIDAILAAHRAGDDEAYARARRAIEGGQAESVLVYRDGWRAVTEAVDAPTTAWTRALLSGCDLSTALQQAGDEFVFSDWLAAAIQSGWMKEVRVTSD